MLIGTKFIKKSKNREDVCTVLDCYTTTNSNGDIIKKEYLASYDFCGQEIKILVPSTTIIRNKI